MDHTPDLSQLMQMARSPAGQQLLKLLQQQSGEKLDTAARLAASGRMEQAKEILSDFFSTEQAQALLRQLESET